ncbi:unnamed protein product [Adineta steineri]|uniref:Aquaporin n=1 Tax=Adineta steineri TaxID=433720 RepID=A0A814WFA6_9BILA|nr:unnamed protein product [Adineta steineri]CAF3918618.1 unnamed protein product [Adineta steineri]
MIKRKELEQYSVHLLAECCGTCILIFIGEGSIANYKFSRQTSHSTFPITLAFGIGVYSAMMIAGSITGAHINPAVSLSLMTIGKLKPLQCIFYIIGQIIGGFLGGFLVYTVFQDQFNEFDGGIRQILGSNGTGDIFFTMPGKGVSHWNAFIDQFISTAFLMIYVMALTQDFNKMISERIKPFAFVLIVMGITSAFSINAGAAMNPARDLGPRLFSAFIYGWKNVFTSHNYYFYIPIIGPIFGGIFGVWFYHGYLWIIINFGHLSNNQNKNDNYSDIQIKDDNSLELQQKLTSIDN